MEMYLVQAEKIKWAQRSEIKVRITLGLWFVGAIKNKDFFVRCELTVPFTQRLQKVKFYVNKKLYEAQYVVPYYLNAINGRGVRPFFMGKKCFLKITFTLKYVRSAKVVIRKECVNDVEPSESTAEI